MPPVTTNSSGSAGESTRKRVLSFTPEAWDKIWALTDACPTEISAIGIVAEGDPNLVEDFFMVKQRCSSVRTELDPEALQELTLTLDSIGVSPSRMRVWWHSHVNMSTSLSGTDYDNIRRYASAFLWSIVTNKRDASRVLAGLTPAELNIQLDTFDPRNEGDQDSPLRSTTTGCGWAIRRKNEFLDWAKEQVAQHVNPFEVALARTAGTYRPQYAGPYSNRVLPGQSHGKSWLDAGVVRNGDHQRNTDISFKDAFIDEAYAAGFLTRGEALAIASAIQRGVGSTELPHANTGVAGLDKTAAVVEDLVLQACLSLSSGIDKVCLRASLAAYLTSKGFTPSDRLEDGLENASFLGLSWNFIKTKVSAATDDVPAVFDEVNRLVYASAP